MNNRVEINLKLSISEVLFFLPNFREIFFFLPKYYLAEISSPKTIGFGGHFISAKNHRKKSPAILCLSYPLWSGQFGRYPTHREQRFQLNRTKLVNVYDVVVIN